MESEWFKWCTACNCKRLELAYDELLFTLTKAWLQSKSGMLKLSSFTALILGMVVSAIEIVMSYVRDSPSDLVGIFSISSYSEHGGELGCHFL